MKKRIIYRLILIFPSLFILTFLIFCLMYYMPGNAGHMILMEKTGSTNITSEKIADFENEQHINTGFLSVFLIWSKYLLKGNLGKSFVDGKNINKKVLSAFNKTFIMSTIALIIYSVIGSMIGIVSAIYESKLLNRIVNYWAVFSTSIPAFWIALFVVWLFSVKFHFISICGARGFASLILPGVLMGFIYMGNIIIIIKEKTLSIWQEAFIVNAIAMGLGRWQIIKVHILKNILAPVVSMSTLALSNFLGFSIVMENIFSIKGIGSLMHHAIGIKDYMVVASGVLLVGFIIILFNTFADIIYIFIDRRGIGEHN